VEGVGRVFVEEFGKRVGAGEVEEVDAEEYMSRNVPEG
jgi:hypothetical protein